MNTEASKLSISPQFPQYDRSPLQNHPISFVQPLSPTEAMMHASTYPSARLSSSPASSPRIVESPPKRRRSIKPEMEQFSHPAPGPDFFHDSSDDDDLVGQKDNMDIGKGEEPHLNYIFPQHATDREDEQRGRSRHSPTPNPLQPFDPSPSTHDFRKMGAKAQSSPPLDRNGTSVVRHVSLHRHGKVRVVHNRGAGSGSIDQGTATSRQSLTSDNSSAVSVTASPIAAPSKQSPEHASAEKRRVKSTITITAPTPTEGQPDPILNAQKITMHHDDPFETFDPASINKSFSKQRHIEISPITIRRHDDDDEDIDGGDSDRPTTRRLPVHFIKTPYPKNRNREFPKPASRPRSHHHHHQPSDTTNITTPSSDFDFNYKHEHSPEYDGEYHDNKKGKHILGIQATNDSGFDLRSRQERNEDAQGAIRSNGGGLGRRYNKTWESGKEGAAGDSGGSVVWMSLRQRSGGTHIGVERVKKMTYFVVPSRLTMPSTTDKVAIHGIIQRKTKKNKKNKAEATLMEEGEVGLERSDVRMTASTTDFDDQVFAQKLREGYMNMAGPWTLRMLSARTLSFIRLQQVNVWSGGGSNALTPKDSRFLATGRGIEMDTSAASPFTEDRLMKLCRNPSAGKARYTWVHWARRVAASNARSSSAEISPTYTQRQRRHMKKTYDATAEEGNEAEEEQTTEDEHNHDNGSAGSDHHHLDPLTIASPSHHNPPLLPDTITTIQFVHAFSARRIIFALATIMMLSVAASLLWIFLGESPWALGEQKMRAERVGSGMAIGLMVLLLEGICFVGWVVGSWYWD